MEMPKQAGVIPTIVLLQNTGATSDDRSGLRYASIYENNENGRLIPTSLVLEIGDDGHIRVVSRKNYAFFGKEDEYYRGWSWEAVIVDVRLCKALSLAVSDDLDLGVKLEVKVNENGQHHVIQQDKPHNDFRMPWEKSTAAVRGG